MVQHLWLRFLKSSLSVGVLTHIVFTISLIFIGEYTTTLLLQFIYIISFNNRLFIYIYLPIINFILVKLFSSSNYILYFFNLFTTLFLINKLHLVITFKAILFFIIFVSFTYTLIWWFEQFLYDIYLLIDIEDSVNFITLESITLLSLLHTLILFIYMYNTSKRL